MKQTEATAQVDVVSSVAAVVVVVVSSSPAISSLPLTWQPGSVATNSRKQYCGATSWVAQSCLKGACFSGRVEDPRVACAGSDSSTTWYGHHDV